MNKENLAKGLEALATPIENIDLLPGNPRKGDIKAVAKSYETFGQRKPIVVKKTGENDLGYTGIVIAGNHQLQAAKLLGWEKIAAVFVEDDEDTAKAYALADNRTAELGGYDPEALEKLVEELRDTNPELLGATGWTDKDLAEVIGGSLSEKNANINDTAPELPKKVVSKLGDVWTLGKHKLICGDSSKAETYDKLLGNDKAHLLLTDPPWNINYQPSEHPKYKKRREIKNDNLGELEWDKFLTEIAKRFFEYTKSGAPAYIFMGVQTWPQLHKAITEAGFHWSSTIIWVKDIFTITRKDYHAQYEAMWNGHNGPYDPVWYGWNEKAARIAEVLDRTQSDVWLHERPQRSDIHPMMKPVELLNRAIENSSNIGSIVLDPFGGSGSTLMSCVATGRIGRIIELDPAYCDVIARRWQEAVGEIPKLNGEPVDLTPNFIEVDKVARLDKTGGEFE
jgi:DNA modification methylase